ncbi:polysaccharide pyruvyl transferase CsaB [Natranaerobius thermophilus]|uniref:Polysaccharide pyruvyl transferase n=1 Tax=Natranaerobius thermophilus (strain ATCC BAA-1301 / DSM 18059 / JW/NM-WN-LF) TaxID=457570 RepID=B2A0R4_NATTJ|nr:polysaccharide pyruvyl transferase CsaB [Natranaerobius thermophilus]ACB85944.1 polysaccharide pyruvyl transferase [Natranaerobius thermophilus JW/NM-WN-LF]
MGKNIVIQGYYGAGNTGDEAILSSIIQNLQEESGQEQLHFTVFSREPEATKREHGVESVYTGRMLSGMKQVVSTIKNCHLFVSGGGGLLQDAHPRVVPYWLSRVVLAKLFRKPVVFYAQGVGPIYRPLSKLLIRWILPGLDLITVRDNDSKELLEHLGVSSEKIQVTADPAFTLESVSQDKILSIMDRVLPDFDTRSCFNKKTRTLKLDNNEFEGDSVESQDPSDKWIGVSLRSWGENEKLIHELAQYLDEMSDQGYKILFIPMQYLPDLEVSKKVRKLMYNTENVYLFDYQGSPREMLTVLSMMDINIAMRLHAAIFSLKSCVPTIGLSYQPKVASVFDEMEQSSFMLELEEINCDQLLKLTGKIQDNFIPIQEKLLFNSKRLQGLARNTAKFTLDCLT